MEPLCSAIGHDTVVLCLLPSLVTLAATETSLGHAQGYAEHKSVLRRPWLGEAPAEGRQGEQRAGR